MTRKVMRPKAWDPKKVKFPVWLQPKVDGMRGYNPDGVLLARTQKQYKNVYTTAYFSKPYYIGFDGELAAERETHPDLCRITGSAINSITGEPYVIWHVFDYVTQETKDLPYSSRYIKALHKLDDLQARGLATRINLVPYVQCNNLQELEAAHQRNMEAGYEGSCIYNPRLPHKEGDSSASHGGVNRIKDFIDFEAEVLSIEEGQENLNEAQINELGRQFRSSHQANKVGNGLVGNLLCRSLIDVYDLYDATKLLIAKGKEFTCSPGNMDHPTRAKFFSDQTLIVGKIIKVKFFPKGIKDAPRFPTYVCIRSKEDM